MDSSAYIQEPLSVIARAAQSKQQSSDQNQLVSLAINEVSLDSHIATQCQQGGLSITVTQFAFTNRIYQPPLPSQPLEAAVQAICYLPVTRHWLMSPLETRMESTIGGRLTGHQFPACNHRQSCVSSQKSEAVIPAPTIIVTTSSSKGYVNRRATAKGPTSPACNTEQAEIAA